MSNCSVCGKPITEGATNCSKHRWAGKKSPGRPKKAEPAERACSFDLKCARCGKDFSSPNRTALCCSVPCRNRMNAAKRKPAVPLAERSCAGCGKFYSPLGATGKFCSVACRSRYHYRAHPEAAAKQRRRKITKIRIGLNIRDAALSTPTKEAKNLWDGIGRWSVKYWPDIQDCLECGTHVYKHAANGVCARCYEKLKNRDPEKTAALKRKWYERMKTSGRAPSQKQALEWIGRAMERSIEVTPTIANLLDNLENL